MFGKKYLLADIGATNTRLAIVNEKFDFIKRAYHKNDDMTNIDDAIRSFAAGEKVSVACLAVAAPLNADRTMAHFTNYNWEINSLELSKKIKAKTFLLNDFEALGLTVDSLKNEHYFELTTKGLSLSGTVSMIGAGTGLGMSILYPFNKRHYPLPSEGCHSSIFFNPESRLEMDLYKYLRKKKIVIEAESLVSGRGIEAIYDFLLTKRLKHNSKLMKEIQNSKDKPSLITKYAMQDRDALCIKTVELFILFYARVSRDLALKTLCTTLVIAGGIAPKILPVMKEVFLDAFLMHEHIEARKLLENITVIVLTDPDMTIYGCYRALKA
jgi:glucokinase